MAPRLRSVRPTQNGGMNGLETTNGDHLPPPSTIAAQIVHNRSTVARQEPENKALFGKLLQEYLTDPVIEDSNVETNAQLIQVVAEAGLDVLLSDNPFAPAASLEEAPDSLLVIKLSVIRKPQVLLYQGEDGTHPPLALWLLAKVGNLCARPNLSRIQDDLAGLIHSIAKAPMGKTKTWSYGLGLEALLRGIVDETLSILEDNTDTSGVNGSKSLGSVPSANLMASIWPDANNALVLPAGYQINLRSSTEALCMLPRFLAALWNVHSTSELGKSLDLEPWLFDCCYRFIDTCGCLPHATDKETDQNLETLCLFVSRIIIRSRCSKRKIAPLLDLLVAFFESLDPDKHHRFALAVEETAEALLSNCLGDEHKLRYCRKALLPLLRELSFNTESSAEPSTLGFVSALTEKLSLLGQTSPSNVRPAKRQRREEPSASKVEQLRTITLSRIALSLTGSSDSQIRRLGSQAVNAFKSCEQDQREMTLDAMKLVPCLLTEAMDLPLLGSGQTRCNVCDSGQIDRRRSPFIVKGEEDAGTCRQILAFTALLIEDPQLRKSKSFRVSSANLIRRIANHIADNESSMLNWKGIGPWLFRSLQSSVRELRLASSEALISYLREDLPESIRNRNRLDALDFLKALSEQNNLSDQETLVTAWGLVARSCGETELNLALIQLVDYLAHTHPVVSGAAYHELLALADDQGVPILELFKPYWSSIATHVIKDMFVCPQKIQQVADLLGMSVNDLVLHTQSDTVPYLVLTRKKDVLQRIAQARGPSISIQNLWLQPSKNLAAVMALLLVQQSDDVEMSALALLQDLAPGFTEHDLSGLVRVDPIMIACEILRHAGDYPDAKKPQAHQGLRLLAVINERKPGTKSSKSSKYLSAFLESHILGIMSHYTDIVDATTEKQRVSEKKRALRAINELITAAKAQVGIAIPQIRATLQSAFKVPDLIDSAFATWSTLILAAGEEEAETLIDGTFALIVHYWNEFTAGTQKLAYDTIAELIKRYNSVILERTQMLPSLAGIEMLQKFESEINRFKAPVDPMIQFQAFAQRCADENSVIVHRALIDLAPYLEIHQKTIHEAAISSNPSEIVATLSRALLDAVVRFKEHDQDIPELAARCLGAIGCIDPNRVDQRRERKDMLMLSNFERADEVISFAADMLEHVLVDAFHSAPTGRTQTYLAYAMQELLKFCKFRSALYRPRPSQNDPVFRQWMKIPESVRSTLTPFFNTKYVLVHPSNPANEDVFPILRPGMTHATWIRTLVFSLMHKATTLNAQMMFQVLSRVIWGHDIAIPRYLLPFVVLNVAVGGNKADVDAVNAEFLRVLAIDTDDMDPAQSDEVKQCSENIFQVLDYLSRWLQAKKKTMNEFASGHSRSVNVPDDFDVVKEMSHVSSVEAVLSAVPADVLSRRAVQCRSFARALFHYEQYIRQTLDRAALRRENIEMEDQFRHLQDIYAQIEEPDCVEGMSTKLQILDPEQQILEHKRAGRWTAAQTWYELAVVDKPEDKSLQLELLNCLKASSRYGQLLDTTQSMATEQPAALGQLLTFGVEAAWATGRWDSLQRFLGSAEAASSKDFNAEMGKLFLALKGRNGDQFNALLSELRRTVANGLSSSSTTSLVTAHPHTIKLHALYEIDQIGGLSPQGLAVDEIIERLDRRLDVLGAFRADKQFILGVRRAAIALSKLDFSNRQLGAVWLTSAQLARKAGLREAAYDAVLHATRLQDGAAMIEHARLLWGDGHHRKAIQNLQGALESNAFHSYTTLMLDEQTGTTDESIQGKQQNFLVAKTQLLLAKWKDRAGHSKADELRGFYKQVVTSFTRWEKGHYYLGKYYLKILESEKALPRTKQSEPYLTADVHKLVIDNFIRSWVYGAKYYYESIPKMLTIWLDVAADVYAAELKPRGLDQHLHGLRVRKLEVMHKQIRKYVDRLNPFVFYNVLPQMLSRINHPHAKANELLLHTMYKCVSAHPQQSLWGVLAVSKSRASDKSSKATVILNNMKRIKSDGSALDVKHLIAHGEKLTNALLSACEVPVDNRSSRASLQRDLHFNLKLAPCQLVVPVEKALSATLPTGVGAAGIRTHKAFARVPITISSFQDDVLVLSSLQRPKKLVMRGSDGEEYGLLCKPKDDLRKDQRLMEFTTMIDRGLKRDVESSKRRLYIHTYAVTPLNEECGAIEWIEGLKPMRDIILANYKAKGLRPDYGELRTLLDRACNDPDNGSWKIFVEQIMPKFPAVLHEWFIDTFAEPESWFAARLRYTRSCAVMSMVGNALGLGDRHGENILLEEGNGGAFHVDFNCLFDKGLTFEKPELVPFRLTQNMIDAMGVYGYEGPFRVAAELTLKILKQYEDTLMTIMETFLYDPTTDFISKPKKKVANVPETPAEVLESVKAKIHGLLPGESVPLSVDGYADALIKMAVNPRNLAGMYIGWCAFF